MRHNEWGQALRLCLVGVVVVAVVLMLGVTAAAGGGAMFEWNDRSYYEIAFSPGDLVSGSTSVWIKGRGLGRPEDGPFFAYLIPPRQESPFPPGIPDDAVAIGEVALDDYDQGATRSVARISFTVPDVEPGRYYVMHCNDPCESSLGDIMTTPITIAADEADGRATVAIDRLDRKSREHSFLIRRVRRDVAHLPELRKRVAALEGLARDLQDRVVALEALDDSATSGISAQAGAAAGGGLALLGAWGLARARGRRALLDRQRRSLQTSDTPD